MAIVNVTPDSFSDGGERLDPVRAIDDGLRFVAEGADILDVGGESTRPGSAAVSPEEECRRVLRVVEGLVRHGAVVSLDTRRALVAEAGLVAGARIVNDVSALRDDAAMLPLVVRRKAAVVLMHRRGRPGSAMPVRPTRTSSRMSGGSCSIAPRPARRPVSNGRALPSIPVSASARRSRRNWP
jgi:dihydropteroate synthase